MAIRGQRRKSASSPQVISCLHEQFASWKIIYIDNITLLYQQLLILLHRKKYLNLQLLTVNT